MRNNYILIAQLYTILSDNFLTFEFFYEVSHRYLHIITWHVVFVAHFGMEDGH